MGMANSVQLEPLSSNKGSYRMRTDVEELRMLRNIYIHWKVKEEQSVNDTKRELTRR